MKSFEAFIETAWTDHVDHAEDVAIRLASSLDLVQSAAQIPPFARLAIHVYGEHLARWTAGIELLQSLRKLPAWDGSPDASAAVTRGISVLQYAGGLGDPLPALTPEDRISVLATASSAFMGQRDYKRAIATYDKAFKLAASGLPSGSPALRSLAAGGNNLAAGLEEKADRDAVETQGMVAAAEGGLKYWKLAGTWLEEERAEHRLARCLLQAGNATSAVEHAQRCVDVCVANDAPPFERFFACAVLALSRRQGGDERGFAESRAEALHYAQQVAPEEKQWCESELKALG